MPELSVFQPLNFKQQADVEHLAALKPDLLLVAAYGLILPQSVLNIPRLGAIRRTCVPAARIPWRSAHPTAIMDGRHVTGITIMQMEAGLDTGDILLQRSLAIGIDDTAQSCTDQLADLGGRLLTEALDKMPLVGSCACRRITPAQPIPPSCARKKDSSTGTSRHGRTQSHSRAFSMRPGSWFDWTGLGKPLRLTVHPGTICDLVPAGVALGKAPSSVSMATTCSLPVPTGSMPCPRSNRPTASP